MNEIYELSYFELPDALQAQLKHHAIANFDAIDAAAFEWDEMDVDDRKYFLRECTELLDNKEDQ